MKLILNILEKIHQQHSNCPLAPHNYVIKPEDLSPKACELLSDIRLNPNSYNSEKLTTTLWGLNNYVVHSLILDFYVSQGLIVTKVKRGISFVYSNFLNLGLNHVQMRGKIVLDRVIYVGKIFRNL